MPVVGPQHEPQLACRRVEVLLDGSEAEEARRESREHEAVRPAAASLCLSLERCRERKLGERLGRNHEITC